MSLCVALRDILRDFAFKSYHQEAVIEGNNVIVFTMVTNINLDNGKSLYKSG